MIGLERMARTVATFLVLAASVPSSLAQSSATFSEAQKQLVRRATLEFYAELIQCSLNPERQDDAARSFCERITTGPDARMLEILDCKEQIDRPKACGRPY